MKFRCGPHGGDSEALAAHLGLDAAAVLDLSASLNPLAPDAAEVVGKHLDAVGRYPDATRATAALAEAMGVPAENLLLTNGGAQAIDLVAGALGGWVTEPEFGLHPRSRLNPAGQRGPRWRSDPHNPSGRLAGADEAAGVWDEAFYPLATGRWTAGRSGSVVGSLTKVFACPGLRLGYVLGDPDEAWWDGLTRAQPLWSVNGLGAASLPGLLERTDLKAWASGIGELRRDLVAVLEVAGLHAEASDANWVLVKAPGLRDRLAERAVLVRDCGTFGLEGFVRIAVPTADGLVRLQRALEGVANGDETGCVAHDCGGL